MADNIPSTHVLKGEWALILGASSGFGAACARELGRHGVNIFGVHLDRRSTMSNVEALQADLAEMGVECHMFNINAADADKRQAVIDTMTERLGRGDGPSTVKILIHSLAFGTLKPFTGEKKPLSTKQMDMTLDVMAHTLVYWTQPLVDGGLMGEGGRIFAMSSSGDARVIPSYGPVSAAKAALEAHIRQLAYELAPKGITANTLRAGVTDTPALRKIPGSDTLLANAAAHNPAGRLTCPQDVAEAIIALSGHGSHWISGNVIGVDGGEDIVAA